MWQVRENERRESQEILLATFFFTSGADLKHFQRYAVCEFPVDDLQAVTENPFLSL